MEIDYTGFAIRLEFLMNEKNMTLQQLANEIGVNDASVIVRWKKGHNGIRDISTISKIAKVFNVKPDWLLYGFIRR